MGNIRTHFYRKMNKNVIKEQGLEFHCAESLKRGNVREMLSSSFILL